MGAVEGVLVVSANLASGASWVRPVSPESPPGTVSRESVRMAVAALGLPVDDVKEILIGPSQIQVQSVARDDSGAVVMLDGLAVYRVHSVVIVEPDGSTT